MRQKGYLTRDNGIGGHISLWEKKPVINDSGFWVVSRVWYRPPHTWLLREWKDKYDICLEPGEIVQVEVDIRLLKSVRKKRK